MVPALSGTQAEEDAQMAVAEAGEVWRCDICGNVVEVREVGGGELFCCGGPMTIVAALGAATSSRETAEGAEEQQGRRGQDAR